MARKPPASSPDFVTVTNRSAAMMHMPDGVRFLPGHMQMPREVWEEHKKNPAVQVWIRAKMIVEGFVELPDVDPFDKLSPEACAALLENESDLAFLNEAANDFRDYVSAAAKVRLAALAAQK